MFRLLRYLHTCKKETILTPVFVILEVVAEILIPVFMGILIDDGLNPKNPGHENMTLVWQCSIIMVILAALALLFGMLSSKYAAIVSNQIGRNLRHAQYERIQDYAFENIDHFATSSLITRMTLDVQMVQNAVQMNIRIAFRAPVMIIFSIVSAAIIGGPMALIFVGIAPVIGFGIWFVMKSAHQYFVKMFKKIDGLNLDVQESLAGIRTIKSYVREEKHIKAFEQTVEDVSQNAKKAERWVALNNPIFQFSIFITFLLVSWFGAYRMVYNGFTEGQFANIISYVTQVLMSLMMLSQVFLMIVISKASVKRITEVLDEKSVLLEIENPLTTVKDGSVIFDHVAFKYSDKMILNDINLNIPQGSFVGIFGATGTGKTSLVQLISRLYDVNEGKILVGGKDVKSYELATLRKEVITVLQKNVLFSGTIADNLRWGKRDATEAEMIQALKQAQAYEFVMEKTDGLQSHVEQAGVNFSGGQRQRLSIARALIGNPKVLILDDSTSAVDTKTDALIRQSLKVSAPDMTKIMIAQRLQSLEDANQIILLDSKGIQAIGTHQSLYASNEMYKATYDAQAKGKEV